MALTAEQHLIRDNRIGASFVPALMAGKADAILREWKRLVGAPDYEAEDLADVWAVQLGSYLEPFALDWWERRNSRPLTRRGESVVHQLGFVSCTLDAWRGDDNTVIDCKVIGPWRKIDEACAYYLPQIIVQRDCVGADKGSLLIVHGGSEPQEYQLDIDADYAATVWERIHAFWRCVEDLTPPVEMPAALAPVPAVKKVDMSQSNMWCEQAAVWLQTYKHARSCEIASKELKKLAPLDAKRAFGAGIEIVRDRANRMSIREIEV